ncbi:carbohydrate-binding module family 50 protein [Daldinia sp. EC12]|nr:carbohydrate-binding module family 50 protein [Daldinia sp. EC12]
MVNMRLTSCVLFILPGFLSSNVYSQQFEDITLGLDYPGISDACSDALNTTVSKCPGFLVSVSIDNPRLNPEQLSSLCTSDCRTSLTNARKTIASGCNQKSDTLTLDGVVWPATYVIDRFLYTRDISCRKDKASGKYCDEVLTSWLGSKFTSDQNCSDCMLGVVQTQLNSPFGYHDEFADDFKSITQSCSASGYAFTSPAPYSVTYIPPETTDAPTCSDPYVVKSGESCDSIATSQNVSTFGIIKAGSLSPTCSNLLSGDSLCLPSPSSHKGLTATDLLAWNPNINALCTNLGALVTTLICVSPPGGKPGDVTITIGPPTPTDDPTTPVPKPTNGKDESTDRCAKWYTVQDGDYCENVSIRQSISLRDFYFLNPSIDANCTNLLLDIAFCVLPVGDINTYSGYPYSTSSMYSLTRSAYVTTTPTLPTVVVSTTPISSLPTAPGTLANCADYVEYIPVQSVADQSQQPDVPLFTDSINSCDFATTGFGVSLDDFLLWNPSLSSVDPCRLQKGYSYCARNSSSYSIPPIATDGLCLNVTKPYPGTISTCSCFTEILGSDASVRPCEDIAIDANISTKQLTQWNPWVGSDCGRGIYADLAAADTRPVCIGTNSTDGPTGTMIPTSSSSSSPTQSSSSAAPTQTGIAAGCTKYHIAVKGDGCWAVANQYGITLDQFYAWNPAVGSDCQNLWLGYAYCVAVAASTGSTTATRTGN